MSCMCNNTPKHRFGPLFRVFLGKTLWNRRSCTGRSKGSQTTRFDQFGVVSVMSYLVLSCHVCVTTLQNTVLDHFLECFWVKPYEIEGPVRVDPKGPKPPVLTSLGWFLSCRMPKQPPKHRFGPLFRVFLGKTLWNRRSCTGRSKGSQTTRFDQFGVVFDRFYPVFACFEGLYMF
jgi:hypothetical protein